MHPQGKAAQTQPQPQEGLCLDVSATQTPSEVPNNGAQSFQAPVEVLTAKQAEEKYHFAGKGRKRVIDIGGEHNAGMREWMATLADKNGYHLQAIHLRGQQYDPSFMAGFSRAMSHQVTVGNIATVIVVGVVTLLLWEGIAYKNDLPRFGIFDPSDPIKALRKN